MKKALFCLGLFLLSAALQAQSKWTDEGCYDISWYDKDAETYSISSASQLAGLAYLVNNATDLFEDKVVELTADIDLAGKEWVPIGDNDQMVSPSLGVPYPTAFCGTFDGMEGGSIKVQLTTNLPYEKWNRSIMTGGVCGKGNTVSHCTSSVSINVATRYTEGYTGGILGQGYVEYCENTGKVTGTNGSCIGGVLGKGSAYRCVNNGDVTVLGREVNVGGIVGDANWADGCVNHGSLSYSSIANEGYVCNMGGIAGQGTLALNCTNYGEIQAEASYPEVMSHMLIVAGICGEGEMVANSANRGNLKVYGTNGMVKAAGINAYGNVDNCYSTGGIETNTIEQDAIALPVTGEYKVTNCYYSQGTGAYSNSTPMDYGDMCKDDFTQKLNARAIELCTQKVSTLSGRQPAEWQTQPSQTPLISDKTLHTLTVMVYTGSYSTSEFLNYTCPAGSISVDHKAVCAGTEIKVNVIPGENCTFQKLSVYKLEYMQDNPGSKGLLFEQTDLAPHLDAR